MNKIEIIKSAVKTEPLIKMRDMNPLTIARISAGAYKGEIVMRTANSETMEVMSLSDFSEDKCWIMATDIMVQPLPDATITINLNE